MLLEIHTVARLPLCMYISYTDLQPLVTTNQIMLKHKCTYHTDGYAYTIIAAIANQTMPILVFNSHTSRLKSSLVYYQRK